MASSPRTDSEVVTGAHGAVTFSGKDAVLLFRAKAIKIALATYIDTGLIPTRYYQPKRMLRIATEYTKKEYRNGKAGQRDAVADLQVWISAMESAMPVRREG